MDSKASRKRLYRIKWRRHCIEKARKEKNARIKHWIKYGQTTSSKSFQSFQQQPIRTIECPEVLDLSDNLQDTLGLIQTIRTWVNIAKRTPIYVDFPAIRHISPAAALVLSAEIHRWSIFRPRGKIGATTINEWSSSVKRLFFEMGLFKLINIENRELISHIPRRDHQISRVYMPFFHGHLRDPKKVLQLRKKIEELTGRLRRRHAFYDGLTEAIVNVIHHAYPYDNDSSSKKYHRWWISASIDPENKSLKVMCLDHGIGIPESLRSSKARELDIGVSQLLKRITDSDFELIHAAVEGGRTSTGFSFRGKGLRKDIKRYISEHGSSGSLRIYSAKGHYQFQIDETGNSTVESSKLHTRFPGTFIEWSITDFAE